jgi:histidyl-tRNA synthetase
MENLSTLMGKYGEEGDKLLFKILNSGNYLEGCEEPLNIPLSKLTAQISEKGLRYDLTVPFARFVVQHQNEITFPFKRYQVQPVWRADRPQKGRYREFFQCDADVVGSNSPMYEAELAEIVNLIFGRLGLGVIIKMNNRKILAGIAEAVGEPGRMTDITVAIDKIDKIGLDKVNEELAAKGVSAGAIEKLRPVLGMEGTTAQKFQLLDTLLVNSEIGLLGLSEMRTVIASLEVLNLMSGFEFDLRLARGLNYYTGTIIEVKAADAEIGSICGGGRYDDLTGIFGLSGVSGVGISFGAARIYDVMLEKNLFPETLGSFTTVLFANFGTEEQNSCLKIASLLREKGISAEIYPEPAKLKKQLEYANKKNIPFVALVGKDEISSGNLTIKNMATGEQQSVTAEDFINSLGK